MQEDYEEQIKSAEESKTRELEELTQLYEAKLQEKTRLLVEVRQKEQEEKESSYDLCSYSFCPACFV